MYYLNRRCPLESVGEHDDDGGGHGGGGGDGAPLEGILVQEVKSENDPGQIFSQSCFYFCYSCHSCHCQHFYLCGATPTIACGGELALLADKHGFHEWTDSLHWQSELDQEEHCDCRIYDRGPLWVDTKEWRGDDSLCGNC